MKLKSSAAALLIATTATVTSCSDTENKTDRPMDKTTLTFNVADNVRTEKVHFKNRFGIALTGDMYIPKDTGDATRLPAIAVCGPFGAVKEQASGYWANRLAAEGFISLAFDPSFTGESGGEPRFVSSPDINTEDFSAAVDYLMSRDDVDSSNIGITGIC
ncbi:MAG: alpha/beta hydrolase, partial [Muribaculaceae bacterium]|nr:alpha/beta hydrolase [Muribaculaceae bacterium]